MTESDSNIVAQTMCNAVANIQETIRMAVHEYERPSTVHKPRLFVDGNQWCALYGDDIQNGVAGFGNSPHEASLNFDKEWYTSL